MEFRHFQKKDYNAVCAFLNALNRENRDHIHWNWARFEWMWGHPDFDTSLIGSIGLWVEEDRVVGAAIYDMYFGEAFCAALPEYEDLYPEILDYAWRELKDENGLGIAICENSAKEVEAAKAAGFEPAEATETNLVIELDRPLSFCLPEGLRFESPDPETEGEALQWMFWQGFNHGEDRAEFEREDKIPPRPRPHFTRQLNVAAVDEAGAYCAYCCLWYLPGTDFAYVEPVCTIPAWRKKGAGRAVVCEALNRARALGARRAYVISDQVFYKKLGFEKDRLFRFWWKKE